MAKATLYQRVLGTRSMAVFPLATLSYVEKLHHSHSFQKWLTNKGTVRSLRSTTSNNNLPCFWVCISTVARKSNFRDLFMMDQPCPCARLLKNGPQWTFCRTPQLWVWASLTTWLKLETPHHVGTWEEGSHGESGPAILAEPRPQWLRAAVGASPHKVNKELPSQYTNVKNHTTALLNH